MLRGVLQAGLRAVVQRSAHIPVTSRAAVRSFVSAVAPRKHFVFACARRASSTSPTETKDIGEITFDHITYQRVQQAISDDPRHAVKFAEFASLCKKFGLGVDESRNVARGLHRAGLVIFHEGGLTPLTKDVLLLKPQVAREMIDHIMEIHASGAQDVQQYIATLRKELDRLRAEIAPLQALKEKCDTAARRHADRVILGALGFLVGQWAVFFRLVWWELSWDVMEPISYMLGLTMNIFALLYFATTKSEYTYDALRGRAIVNRAYKEYKKKGLDEIKYTQLLELISETEGKLAKIEALPYPRAPVVVPQPEQPTPK